MAELDLAAAHCVKRLLADGINDVSEAVTHKANFTFLKPCYVGDLIEMDAEVKSVGAKSITVEVKARRDVRGTYKDKRHYDDIAVAEFVFISIGKIDNLDTHPPFLPYKEHGVTI